MLSKCLRVSHYVFEVASTLPYRDLVISNHYPAALEAIQLRVNKAIHAGNRLSKSRRISPRGVTDEVDSSELKRWSRAERKDQNGG